MHYVQCTFKAFTIAAANNANKANDAVNKNKDHAHDKFYGNRKHLPAMCKDFSSCRLQQTSLFLQLGSCKCFVHPL